MISTFPSSLSLISSVFPFLSFLIPPFFSSFVFIAFFLFSPRRNSAAA